MFKRMVPLPFIHTKTMKICGKIIHPPLPQSNTDRFSFGLPYPTKGVVRSLIRANCLTHLRCVVFATPHSYSLDVPGRIFSIILIFKNLKFYFIKKSHSFSSIGMIIG